MKILSGYRSQVCSTACILAGLACMLSVASMLAADPDSQDLRAKAERLQREAQELKAQGKDEAANDMMRQVDDLRAQAAKLQQRAPAERPERQRAARELRAQLDKAQAELQDLPVAGQEQQALKARRRVEELQIQLERIARPGDDRLPPPRERNGGQMPPASPERQRLRHLEIAIDNLHAAGMHELADNLARQVEQIRAGEPRFGGPGARGMQPGREMERLRAELQELRQNLRELNRRVDELSRDRR